MKQISSAALVLAAVLCTPAAWAAEPTAECRCSAATQTAEHKARPKAKPKAKRKGTTVRKAEVVHVPVVRNEIHVPSTLPPINVTQTNSSDNCVAPGNGNGPGLSMSGNAWTDRNCVMLRNGAALWAIGKQEAALALLCGNPEVRDALERTGTTCTAGPGRSQATSAGGGVIADGSAVRMAVRP